MLNAQPPTQMANHNQIGVGIYDSATGNLISDGTHSYSYDSENRIYTVDQGAVTYTYDGDRQRAIKNLGGGGTVYWRGPDGITLAETDLGGNLTAEYIFFNGKRLARIDNPTSSPPTVRYYFSDQLGSTSIVTKGDFSQVLSDSDYYPYGREIPMGGAGDTNHYKFTGKERDSESGLDMFGARYYGSSLGRFMTPDWAAKPISVPYADFGNPQSLNLYSYVKNNPTTTRDADGHCGEDLCIVEGGAAIYIGGAALLAGTAAVLSTPSGQRSMSTFTSAAGQSISNSIGAIKSFFSKDTATSATPGTQTGTQAGSQPKDVYVDPAKYPGSAGHIADAQANGHPDVLTVDRPGASDRRADATAGHATQPGTDRDEYPPAVTREGGTGASVQNIPSSDNRGSGASIGNQIRDVPNGGQIRVIPEKKPDSN
ncbi:MAG TPA: RHS repeat-associated core domain-containing protein [Terriglobales bacterium]|nr:RHS repeat-associated core domain-containing protein [Terriglobales bacterium]